MDGPRFFKLAVRIFAYEGVMKALLLSEQKEQTDSTPQPSQRSEATDDSNVVSLEQFMVSHPGVISRRKVSDGVQDS